MNVGDFISIGAVVCGATFGAIKLMEGWVHGNRRAAETLGSDPLIGAGQADAGAIIPVSGRALKRAAKGTGLMMRGKCVVCGTRHGVLDACSGMSASSLLGPPTCPYCMSPTCQWNCTSAVMASQAPYQSQVMQSSGTNSSPNFPAPLQPNRIEPIKCGPLENAGMKVEDLIGWRLWRILRSGRLASYSQETIWMPGRPMEGEPGDRDMLGVWAFKDQIQAELKLSKVPSGHALGSVRLWGSVVEHSQGYRAQYARIVSIDLVTVEGKLPWDEEPMRALRYLRREYGVDSNAQISR